MEGFADWFAQAVAGSDPGAGLIGTSGGGGGTSSVTMLESPPSIEPFRSAWLARGGTASTFDAILALNHITAPTPTPPGGAGGSGPSEQVCDKKPWLPGCQ